MTEGESVMNNYMSHMRPSQVGGPYARISKSEYRTTRAVCDVLATLTHYK